MEMDERALSKQDSNQGSGKDRTSQSDPAPGQKQAFSGAGFAVRGTVPKSQHDQGKRIKKAGFSGKRSFASVGTVLDQLVQTFDLDRRLKEHALMSLWPSMAGDKFAQLSRPVFIDSEANLVIAVKDSAAAQELSLIKPELLNKLRTVAASVGIKLHGVRFDLKLFWTGRAPLSVTTSEPSSKSGYQKPAQEELNAIPLTAFDHERIAELKLSLSAKSGLETQWSDRILNMFEQELRFKHWRQLQGFPACPGCQEPVQIRHGQQGLCSDCFFERLARS